MAKVSRDMLKGLVKECLFEILLESTGEAHEQLTEARKAKPRRARRKTSAPRRPALDSISFSNKPQQAPEPRPVDVTGITSDPVMASIFEDTARTTLVEQAAAERGKPGSPIGPGISLDGNTEANPFGNAAKNWAHLAFSDKSE